MAEEKLIGHISHFYGKISVGIIELSDGLKVGDKIHILGLHADFEQTIDSMQEDLENFWANHIFTQRFITYLCR